MQNPISEADLERILHRNCEGTEQLRFSINLQYTLSPAHGSYHQPSR